MITKARVEIDGLVASTLVVWRLGARLRATVIVKACIAYQTDGGVELLPPLPIFPMDRWAGENELLATTDLAPFIATPEVMVVGRGPQRTGRARVGFRFERAGAALLDKHVDVDAGQPIVELGPRKSVWPFASEAFESAIVNVNPSEGACFQRAAADQRVQDLKGNEEVVLIGLHAAAPFVRFELTAPSIEAHVRSGQFDEVVPLRLDAVTIGTTEQRYILTWRGSIPVRSEDAVPGLEARVVARPDPRSLKKPAAAAPARRYGPMITVPLHDLRQMADASEAKIAEALAKAPLPFAKAEKPEATPPSEQVRGATPWAAEPIRTVKPAGHPMMQTVAMAIPSAPEGTGPVSVLPTPWKPPMVHEANVPPAVITFGAPPTPAAVAEPASPASAPPPVLDPPAVAPVVPPSVPPPPAVAAIPAVPAVVAPPVEPAKPAEKREGSPWRKETPAPQPAVKAPAAKPNEPLPAPKKDLNAALYKRPKPSR